MSSNNQKSLLAIAIEQFETTEANIVKLERLGQEIIDIIPNGIDFSENPKYEDLCRAYYDIIEILPKIDAWKPQERFLELDEIAQSRLAAQYVDEPECYFGIEDRINRPAQELREYRYRFNKKRSELIRESLIELIDSIDSDIHKIRRQFPKKCDSNEFVNGEHWNSFNSNIDEIDTLLGSSVKRPPRWTDLRRHIHFALVKDFNDIECMDWPSIKASLRNQLYGINDPIPVEVEDLSDLTSTKPKGHVPTKLHWDHLAADEFERLIFSLISDEPGYENPEWLMKTNAPDRGRDLSVYRVITDTLGGTFRNRVIIQCKHWLERSISVKDIAVLREQIQLWEPPRVDVIVIATSGRFSQDTVAAIEKNNQSDTALRIEMWAESHLERLIAARPALIAEFNLR